jgi:RNA polymerase sigma-70 factor (ECF subfamily)
VAGGEAENCVQTDEQLVAASLQGSDGAFDELVRRYRERLLRFLLTRSASREDAEDAIQDTLISAYRYLYSFDSRWRFSTWLYRIALRNVARKGVPAMAEARDADSFAATTGDPLRACLAADDLCNAWLTAKAILPADAYAAMWLRYVEDMPVKEVARALDKSGSWAKVTLMRARQKLEAELAGAAVATARSESYG